MLQTDQQLGSNAGRIAAGGYCSQPLRRSCRITHCSSLYPSKDGWLVQQRELICDAAAQPAMEPLLLTPQCEVGSTSDRKLALCSAVTTFLMKRKTGAGAQFVVMLSFCRGVLITGGLGAMGRPPWALTAAAAAVAVVTMLQPLGAQAASSCSAAVGGQAGAPCSRAHRCARCCRGQRAAAPGWVHV
jgi:hypothetical protein